MVKPVELVVVSLRVSRIGVAVGPVGETTMLSATVPLNPLTLCKLTD